MGCVAPYGIWIECVQHTLLLVVVKLFSSYWKTLAKKQIRGMNWDYVHCRSARSHQASQIAGTFWMYLIFSFVTAVIYQDARSSARFIQQDQRLNWKALPGWYYLQEYEHASVLIALLDSVYISRAHETAESMYLRMKGAKLTTYMPSSSTTLPPYSIRDIRSPSRPDRACRNIVVCIAYK